MRKISWLVAAIFCTALWAPRAKAQATGIVERLSPDTFFYLKWNGAASLKGANSPNHVLQLFNDPDFLPIKIALAGRLNQSMAKPGAGPAPQAEDLLSLLDNAGVFGFTVPSKRTGDAAGDPASHGAGMFLVYDATGKSELIQKLEAEFQAKDKKAQEESSYEFEGVPVRVEGKDKDKSYKAQAGHFYLFANQKELIEDLIARYRGSQAPATTLIHRPEFEAARKYADADSAIEAFGRMPNLTEMIPDDPKNATAKHVVQNLHTEKVHALTMSVNFAGEAMRIRGAVLGDTSPQSLFDLAGESGKEFQTMPVVSANPSFQIMRMNLAALYDLIMRALEGNLTLQQQANVKAGEAMAQAYLGMPIRDALGLFSGEFGWGSQYSGDGTEEKLYAVTIENPEALLRILRATLGSYILAEDSSGGTTFLDFAYPYKDPESGTQRRKFYYVAVTPHLLLAAPRKAILRSAMTQANPGASSGVATAAGGTATGSAAGAASSVEYAQLRSQLPEKLSGLNAADLRLIPWDKILSNLSEQAAETAKKEKNGTPADMSWLKQVNPEIVTRHVHLSVGGWWKDSNGIYFDSFLQ